MYLLFFLTCGKFAGDLWREVWGRGAIEKERKGGRKQLRLSSPEAPNAEHLALLLMAFVQEIQALCYLLL